MMNDVANNVSVSVGHTIIDFLGNNWVNLLLIVVLKDDVSQM